MIFCKILDVLLLCSRRGLLCCWTSPVPSVPLYYSGHLARQNQSFLNM
jgi:hypothetical protein